MVWANKVGPFHNPQEYYSFFSLPYCQPPKKVSQFEGLGEAIQGYELRKSVEELKFGGADQPCRLSCWCWCA